MLLNRSWTRFRLRFVSCRAAANLRVTSDLLSATISTSDHLIIDRLCNLHSPQIIPKSQLYKSHTAAHTGHKQVEEVTQEADFLSVENQQENQQEKPHGCHVSGGAQCHGAVWNVHFLSAAHQPVRY